MTAPPSIELLWWPGCPSHDEALGRLRAALRELALDPDLIEVVRIDTEEDAAREGFAGSPTFRVAGSDLLPPGPDEPAGLTCRVYRLRDGRSSPTPDPADLREALASALAEGAEADA